MRRATDCLPPPSFTYMLDALFLVRFKFLKKHLIMLHCPNVNDRDLLYDRDLLDVLHGLLKRLLLKNDLLLLLANKLRSPESVDIDNLVGSLQEWLRLLLGHFFATR